MTKSRAFLFTDFNLENLKNYKDESTVYICIGEEICPTTNRKHLQGYLYYRNPRSFKSLCSRFRGSHFEVARGSPSDNRAYCSKEQVVWEHGVCPSQGRRCDLDNIRKLICDGASELSIANDFFPQWVQYRRSFTAYRQLLRLPRCEETKVIICTGDTGSGKTRWAVDLGASPVEYTSGGFFIGYHGQEIVLFDDWELEPTMPREVFLKICDRYPCIINIKGGYTNWNPKQIIITTNFTPELWYQGSPAVARRISEIKKFPLTGTEVPSG